MLLHAQPITDPPEYGYEYWRHHHSDCELVHVIWTGCCGILHGKLMPADSFARMFRVHAYILVSIAEVVLPSSLELRLVVARWSAREKF